MIKIAMIRHGKTYGNTLGRYIGVTDEPLCEEGKKELEQRTMDTVELLFVSPLKRCLETADILYPYAKQVKIPEFAECNFGEFENKNYQELKDNPKYQEWIDSMATLAFPGARSSSRTAASPALTRWWIRVSAAITATWRWWCTEARS